ncbi:MAG: hypothetical protein H0Z33_12045 [Bacillaceae bacterium]|nr:hypothetical protein [Bacillaceae bacterium]
MVNEQQTDTGMSFEAFVRAAEELDNLRKQKKELEQKESRLKADIIQYMEQKQVDQVKINDRQTVILQSRVNRREFDVNEASRVLSPDVFQDVLQIHAGKLQEYMKEGRVGEEEFRRILVREQSIKYVLIK